MNGKLYIGQSVDVERRWKDHKNNSNYVYMNNHLYSGIRKYGLDNFTFEVIVECDENMLDKFEIGIIQLYDTTNPKKGYNKALGGSYGKHSDETKAKMTKSRKGKTQSDETKKKISISLKGKPRSDETKKKMSESKIKQYQYQGNIYNGLHELADFLVIKYKNLVNKISRKQIDVTIITRKYLL